MHIFFFVLMWLLLWFLKCKNSEEQDFQTKNPLGWGEQAKWFENCSIIQIEGKVFFRVSAAKHHRIVHKYFLCVHFALRRARLFYFFIIVHWNSVLCAKWVLQHTWRWECREREESMNYVRTQIFMVGCLRSVLFSTFCVCALLPLKWNML